MELINPNPVDLCHICKVPTRAAMGRGKEKTPICWDCYHREPLKQGNGTPESENRNSRKVFQMQGGNKRKTAV